MFKNLMKVASVLAAVVCVSSCSPSGEGVKAVTLSVQVSMPEGFASEGLDGHTVILTSDEEEIQATTDAKGIATFSNLVPNVYDISTSWDITSDEYKSLTGETVQNGKWMISGNMSSKIITSDGTLNISTKSAIKQSLVISKIFYAGNKDALNKNYLAAQFVELYNNGDEDVNLAGIYLGLVETESTPAYMLNTTPDYIYLKQLYRFPSTGKTTVKPGESVIVTNSAVDHTASNSFNLENADFEAKGERFTNNPATPAMELVYSTFAKIPYMNILQGGSMTVVIFSTDEDIDTWERVYKDGASKGNMFLKMPVKYVQDGVDCLKNKATGVDVSTKRLYDYIDAGYTALSSVSGYNGEVMYRKIADTVDGKIKLADTNNSSNDFAVSADVKLGEYK